MGGRASDNDGMNKQDHLEEYLAICQAVYEQMKRDGTWPWAADSTNPEDVIDSESNQNNL